MSNPAKREMERALERALESPEFMAQVRQVVLESPIVQAKDAEIAALRADLAKAREEVEKLMALQRAAAELAGASPGVLAHSCLGVASCLACGKVAANFTASAEAAERARDEAVAEVARLKEALDKMVLVWDAATTAGNSREIAKAMGFGNYREMFDAWSRARRALGRTDGEGAP